MLPTAPLMILRGLFLSEFVLFVSFSDTITLGAVIVAAAVGVTGMVVLGYGARWKAIAQVAGAQADELRKAFDDEKARADSLYKRMTDIAGERLDLSVKVAKLEERPDFNAIMEVLNKQDERATQRTVAAIETLMTKIDERFDQSDKRHEKRHAETADTLVRAVTALERIGANNE